MNVDARRTFWLRWLHIVLTILGAYSLVLVFAGGLAGLLFDALGFGPPSGADSADVRAYLRLPFMVLGAVMCGWAFMMLQIVRGPLRNGDAWALRVLAQALGLWFILDTGMSLALGYPAHAMFNLPFALALGIPLLRLRSI